MDYFDYFFRIPYLHEIHSTEMESHATPKWVVEQILDAIPDLPIRDGMVVTFSYSQSNYGCYYQVYNPEIGMWECHGGSPASSRFARKTTRTQVTSTQVCGWTIIRK